MIYMSSSSTTPEPTDVESTVVEQAERKSYRVRRNKESWAQSVATNRIYPAYVTACYDGDTITANIYLGFGQILQDQKVRLYGINCPEMKGPTHDRGIVARDHLRSLILGKNVDLLSHGDRRCKYGRILATVFVDTDGNKINCNTDLVNRQMAVPYMLDK